MDLALSFTSAGHAISATISSMNSQTQIVSIQWNGSSYETPGYNIRTLAYIMQIGF